MSKRPIQLPPLPQPRLEIINLIDVLLTLLAFFMLSTVFATSQNSREIKIQLPRASQGTKAAVQAHIITLELNRNNVLYYEGRKLRRGELADLFADVPRETAVIIRADRSCRYEWVVALLDQIKRSGLNKVGLEVLGK